LKVAELRAKADIALKSAKVLLEMGDTDGACSRAYYAMFDAARAALIQAKAPVKTEVAKTHNGLSAAFSLHLIKSGKLSADLGRALSRAHETRLLADYTGDPVEHEVAATLVQQAARFVEEITAKLL
jgi:uncharacterized protein (UPF0332 family)